MTEALVTDLSGQIHTINNGQNVDIGDLIIYHCKGEGASVAIFKDKLFQETVSRGQTKNFDGISIQHT
jgi:hypothetical protein